MRLFFVVTQKARKAQKPGYAHASQAGGISVISVVSVGLHFVVKVFQRDLGYICAASRQSDGGLRTDTPWRDGQKSVPRCQ